MSNQKDPDALFEELYRSYYRSVVSLFIRRGFTREEARDLAQTVFVRVYKGRGVYRREATWAYLLEIATRVGLNELRYQHADKRNAETTSLDVMDQLPNLTCNSPTTGTPAASPLEEVLDREKTRQLDEAIQELDPEDRHYLQMWLQGRKYDEIATAMQVSMDTVKSRLYRAKKQLKVIVKKRLGDPNLDWPPTTDGDL